MSEVENWMYEVDSKLDKLLCFTFGTQLKFNLLMDTVALLQGEVYGIELPDKDIRNKRLKMNQKAYDKYFEAMPKAYMTGDFKSLLKICVKIQDKKEKIGEPMIL